MNGLYATRNTFMAEHKLEGKDLVRWKYQQYMKDYLRCIWAVDENIGRVLQYLEQAGLAANTVVMYASDQGFYNGEHGWFDKRFMYEESFRTPFVAKWPGVIKPGSVNADLAQNIDWAETFLGIAGAAIPADGPPCRTIAAGPRAFETSTPRPSGSPSDPRPAAPAPSRTPRP